MFPRKALAFAVIAIALFAGVQKGTAQVGISIGIAPGCPYGYFDYAPYECAPYGYYGPDWFNGGIFIGAGPGFTADRGFYGHVDNRFDPHHGMPDRCRGAGNNSSTTSTETRHAMAAATLATPDMKAVANTHFLVTGAAVLIVVDAARERCLGPGSAAAAGDPEDLDAGPRIVGLGIV